MSEGKIHFSRWDRWIAAVTTDARKLLQTGEWKRLVLDPIILGSKTEQARTRN